MLKNAINFFKAELNILFISSFASFFVLQLLFILEKFFSVKDKNEIINFITVDMTVEYKIWGI